MRWKPGMKNLLKLSRRNRGIVFKEVVLTIHQIGWFLGDTTQSLEYLENKDVDVAITYRKAAEDQALKNGYASERVYGFRDHFMLVGPQ
jgi:ABC-type tungstate transport system permease subunit